MASGGESAAAKQLRIKSGVVVRLEKELARYHEEHAQQAAKIEAMRSSGRDEHDIKKQVEVLEETEMMIPDTIRRLEKAVEDLREAYDTHKDDPSVSGGAVLAGATEILSRHGGSGPEGTPDDEAI